MTQKCPLTHTFLPLGSSLQNTGLALMVGGMLALGAFSAPAVFGHFPRHEAGLVMAQIFRRYDIVLLVALGLVWVGEWLRRCSRQVAIKTPVALVRYLLLAALSVSLLYATQVVNARIEQMNQAGLHRDFLTPQGREFEQTHKLSESLYKADMLMALFLVLLTPFVTRKPNPSTSSDNAESTSCCPNV